MLLTRHVGFRKFFTQLLIMTQGYSMTLIQGYITEVKATRIPYLGAKEKYRGVFEIQRNNSCQGHNSLPFCWIRMIHSI